MTLYSSLERAESQVRGEVLVHQPQGVRQFLAGQHLQASAGVDPGQVAGVLAAAVGDEHGAVGAAVRGRGGQSGGGGVRHVVRDVPYPGRVQSGQGGGQERGGAPGVQGAQLLPGRVLAGAVGDDERGIVGVADGVEFLGPYPGLLQAPPHGLDGQLPRGERNGLLAVLASAEPLLFGRRHDPPVDDERSGRIVKNGVDAEESHQVVPSRLVSDHRLPREALLKHCVVEGAKTGVSGMLWPVTRGIGEGCGIAPWGTG
ncbi:hypothetical protein ABH917_002687 [Thermobifida halotolerans]